MRRAVQNRHWPEIRREMGASFAGRGGQGCSLPIGVPVEVYTVPSYAAESARVDVVPWMFFILIYVQA